MKKYAVFTSSEKIIEYQLSISNKIIERESTDVLIHIIDDWLESIHGEAKFDDWTVRINVDRNDDIYIYFNTKDFNCPYRLEAIKDTSNIKVNLFVYKYKYTTKDVD